MEAQELVGERYEGGVGSGIPREGDSGKAVESNGRDGGRDLGDICVGGISHRVFRWCCDEDGYGEGWIVFHNELTQLHRRYQVSHFWGGKQNYGVH